MFNSKDISIEKFNLKIFQSDLFPEELQHLFSTRLGGDTPAPLDSFTLSAKDYSLFENYAKSNVKKVCSIIGANAEKIVQPNQQHTDKIAIVRTDEDLKIITNEPFDGVITNLKNVPVLLVFADCIPVLIYDKKQKVLACVHAGWKGTAQRISQKAILNMVEYFQSNVNDILVAIGPGIGQECFEVNKDVSAQLGMSIKTDYGNIFLENNDKVHVDLKLLNKIQIQELGVEEVDICDCCTCCNNNIFYSYRADNKITGRHGMLAMIKE